MKTNLMFGVFLGLLLVFTGCEIKDALVIQIPISQGSYSSLTNFALSVVPIKNNSGITHYAYTLGASAGNCNFSTLPTAVAKNTTTTLDLSSLPDGTIQLCVLPLTENGSGGFNYNTANVTSISWVKDTLAPVISITSPASLSTSKGFIQITGTCEAPGHLDLPIMISGDIETPPSVLCSPLGNFSATLTLSNPNSTGTRTIHFSETDEAGNTGNQTLNLKNEPFFTVNGLKNHDSVGSTFTISGTCNSSLPLNIINSSLSISQYPVCSNGTYSAQLEGAPSSDEETFRIEQNTYGYDFSVKIQNIRTPLNSSAIVVYNLNAPDDLELAEYYIQAREMSSAHLCGVELPPGLYATAAQLLGARKTAVEQCICALIPNDKRPSNCTVSNIDAISAVSPITHVVYMRGVPARLKETGWQNDNENPSFDLYFAQLLYRSSTNYFGSSGSNGTNGFLNSFYGNGKDPVKSFVGPLNPAVEKMAVYGRIDGLTLARAKSMIDRTIIAEKMGVMGNFLMGASGSTSQDPDYEPLGNFFRDLTDSQNVSCKDYITAGTAWPMSPSCRVGVVPLAEIPGAIASVPVALNAAMYFNPTAYGVYPQMSFAGNFAKMLKWHRSQVNCTERCRSFPTPAQVVQCQENSTDYFKEINTDCVGVSPGFVGHHVRSWPVQFYGIYPPGWGTGANGATPKLPPQLIETGGYQDARFTDTKFIRFGNVPTGLEQCTLENGTVTACPPLLPMDFRADFVAGYGNHLVTPIPTPASGDFQFRFRFRYRNSASPAGILKVYFLYRDEFGHEMPTSPISEISLSTTNTDWQTFEILQSVSPSLLPGPAQGYTQGTKLLPGITFSSGFANKLTGYLDIDGVELIDETTGTHMISAEKGSFSAPYLDNPANGDWAANIIDRLGGIGWWGSSSHFLTGGFAFGQSGRSSSAFLSGRSLGESVFLAGNPQSGMIYADPLYSPSGVKIYLEGENQFTSDQSTYIPISSDNPEDYAGFYTFSRSLPTESKKRLLLNVLHGRNNAATTQWRVDLCNAGLTPGDCDSNQLWQTKFQGVGAGYGIPIVSDLRTLVGNPNVDQNIFLRLKVWNPGDEANGLYSKAYLRYLVSNELQNAVQSISLESTAWPSGYALPLEINSVNSVALPGVDRLVIQYTPEYDASTVQITVNGIARTDYHAQLLSHDTNTGLAVYALDTAIDNPERLQISLSIPIGSLSVAANILPGNLNQPSPEDIFEVNQDDFVLLDFVMPYYVSNPEFFTPEIMILVDANTDGVLNSDDYQFIQNRIDTGLTTLP